MNTKMIMLVGILLLAGLSFAYAPPGPWQNEWQQYVSYRYNCNLGSMGYGYYSAASMYMQPYADASDFYYMNYYLDIMNREIFEFGPGDYGMAYEYYATPFRSDMAGYNSASAFFRPIFNAAYREYYAATGDSSHNVRNYLAGLRATYASCVISGPWGSGSVTT